MSDAHSQILIRGDHFPEIRELENDQRRFIGVPGWTEWARTLNSLGVGLLGQVKKFSLIPFVKDPRFDIVLALGIANCVV